MITRHCLACGLEFHDENQAVWSRCPRCEKKVNLCPNRIVQRDGISYMSYWNPFKGLWEDPIPSELLASINSITHKKETTKLKN